VIAATLPNVIGTARSATAAFAADELAVTFGVLFAVIWGLSALYAAFTVPHGQRARFFGYFVPSAAGGIAVAFAADAISFYLCFALMALPSWGMVAHARTSDATRAGRIYLAGTVLGEALLLAALMVLVAEAGSTQLAALRLALAAGEHAGLAFGLIAAAFALKLGAFGASGLLPLTYAHTPTGAAAALAGASVKVGVLGLLRLLPLGEVAPAPWGDVLIALGLASAFGAAALGVLTTTPKAVLGYSSASQMGLVLIGVGVGLAAPSAGPYAIAAAVAYSLHHGLAKAALFFGEDVARQAHGRARSAALVALALPALALAGAPLTSGFVAKYALKSAVHEATGALPHLAEILLPWAAVGTALLMLRFLALLRAGTPELRLAEEPASELRASVASWAVWSAALALVASVAWVWPADWARSAAHSALDPASVWAAVWPLAAAVLAAAAAGYVARDMPRLRTGVVAPGDVWLGIDRGLRRVVAPPSGEAPLEQEPPERQSPGASPTGSERRVVDALYAVEFAWTSWAVAAGVFLVVAVVLVALAA